MKNKLFHKESLSCVSAFFFIKHWLDPDFIRWFLLLSIRLPSVKWSSSPFLCTMQLSAHAHMTHSRNAAHSGVTSYRTFPTVRSASDIDSATIGRGVTLLIAVINSHCHLATESKSIVFIINNNNR